ncbi:MAG: tRNA (cytidine(34)-2'-O)-methyltransferase [Lentisphaeria bacterium]|nr:tRNA (cytidine(34)-2'-O)-methyltransferase [Lentisphaeria bacterium]
MKTKTPINIVLFEPGIPQNTGAIGRICVCLDARLHLIKPLGFRIDEKQIKRAGMDYWQHLDLTIHNSWSDFLENEPVENLSFLSTKTDKVVYDHAFQPNEYIVFGSESGGLPKHFYEEYKAQLLTIPMPGEHARSQNLANSVALTAYEAYRQICHQGQN